MDILKDIIIIVYKIFSLYCGDVNCLDFFVGRYNLGIFFYVLDEFVEFFLFNI